MVQITLLELNLEGAEFNAPDVLGGGDVTTTEPTDVDASDGSGSATDLAALVLGLTGLVAVAFVVRKLRGGPDEADEVDVADESADAESVAAR